MSPASLHARETAAAQMGGGRLLGLFSDTVGLPQRQGILNGELLGEQLPELGGLLLSLGLEGSIRPASSSWRASRRPWASS